MSWRAKHINFLYCKLNNLKLNGEYYAEIIRNHLRNIDVPLCELHSMDDI